MTARKDFDIENLFDTSFLVDFNKSLPAPLDSNNTYFTLYARNGLFHLAKNIIKKRPSKNQALVPSYSCGDELEPILRTGFRIIPYSVDSSLQAVSKDIQSKISSKTGVVLLTHYFGFPQKDILKIKNISHKSGSFLIEDCAHTFGGTFNGAPLGSFGDASIFSLRKFLSIPHGGAIVLNNSILTLPDFIPPSNSAVLIDFFIYLGQKNNFFPRGTPIKQIYRQLGLDYQNNHGPRLESFGGYDLALSKLARTMIKKTNLKEVINTRVSNYNRYLEHFSGNPSRISRPLFPFLSSGVVPLAFPIIVENSEQFCQELHKEGFGSCQPFWSYLHEHINWDKYPEEKRIKKSLVSLPVDGNIDEAQVNRILSQKTND